MRVMDVIKARVKPLWSVIWSAALRYTRHSGSNHAAALAFYSVFALAPMLVVVVAVVGLFYGEESARQEVFLRLSELTGDELAGYAQGMLAQAGDRGSGWLATLVGLGTLLYGSSKIFHALRAGLNAVWGALADQQAEDDDAGFMGTVKDYALAIALVPGFGVLFLVMVISSTLMAAFGSTIAQYASLPSWAPRLMDTLLSWLFLSVMFGALFKWLPSVRLTWARVSRGAAVTAALFVVGKWLIGFYLGKTSTGSVFGAAGTLAVLLMWFYLSAQVFFFGAALTRAWGNAVSSEGEPKAELS